MTHRTTLTPHAPSRSSPTGGQDGAPAAAAWQKAQTAAAATPAHDDAQAASRKRRFEFDPQDSSPAGRPDFLAGARKLKPNQSGPGETHEDRRHQLAFEGRSKFLGDTHALAARLSGGAAGADKLLADMQSSHFPGRAARGPKGLASAMNSHTGNLFLGNADENKAVELMRSRSSSFLAKLSRDHAEDPPAEGKILQEARDHFRPDADAGTGIEGRHNEMKQVAHDLLDGAKTDHEAISIVHDLQFDGFFDMDHRTRPEHNGKALDIAQRMYSANISPEGTSLDQRLEILDEFPRQTY